MYLKFFSPHMFASLKPAPKLFPAPFFHLHWRLETHCSQLRSLQLHECTEPAWDSAAEPPPPVCSSPIQIHLQSASLTPFPGFLCTIHTWRVALKSQEQTGAATAPTRIWVGQAPYSTPGLHCHLPCSQCLHLCTHPRGWGLI